MAVIGSKVIHIVGKGNELNRIFILDLDIVSQNGHWRCWFLKTHRLFKCAVLIKKTLLSIKNIYQQNEYRDFPQIYVIFHLTFPVNWPFDCTATIL